MDSELVEKMFGVKNIQMWGHGGSTLGFRTLALYIPEYGVTISVLINDDTDAGLVSIFKALLEVVAHRLHLNRK